MKGSVLRGWLGLAGAALVLNGCAISGLPALGPVATAPVPEPAAPLPVSYGPFLEGAVGQRLSLADRDAALKAEQDALATGQRKPWRGEKGVFGYVEPGPAPGDGAAAGEACRTFTSTIYFSGRPQVGHGRGCQGPDGTYRITG